MGFFGIFKSREEKERLSHIRNLVALSFADGRIDKRELASITLVASREGVSEEKVKDMLKNPQKTDFIIPKTEEKKEEYLRDMVLLMLSDGDIDDNEYTLCKIVAELYGYRHEVIDAILNNIIHNLKAGMR